MPIWVWSIVLLAFLAVALLAIAWVRRRVRQSVDASAEDFSLSDLRRLRESGQIDEEQYQRLRVAIIGAAKKV